MMVYFEKQNILIDKMAMAGHNDANATILSSIREKLQVINKSFTESTN